MQGNFEGKLMVEYFYLDQWKNWREHNLLSTQERKPQNGKVSPERWHQKGR